MVYEPYFNRTFSINEEFFESIDTEAKAYWLGFITADGSINSKACVKLQLQLKDIEHLRKFVRDIDSTHPVKISNRTRIAKSDGLLRQYCEVSVNSRKICRDLLELGICGKKSLIVTPCVKVPEELLKHYWRGCFDGDGTIYPVRTTYGSGFVGNENMVIGFTNFIRKNGIIKLGKPYRKSGNTFTVEYRKYNTASLVKLLYDSSSIYLDRKYKLYKKIAGL